MSIFESIRAAIIQHRFNDELLYEMVYDEIQNNQMAPGLWAKAIAETDGNMDMAKSRYIKYRHQSIKDEIEFDGLNINSTQRVANSNISNTNKLAMPVTNQGNHREQETTISAYNVKETITMFKNTNNRIDVQDNVIVDKDSRLIWTKNANVARSSVSWKQAMNCLNEHKSRTTYGINKWRIPNRKDYKTIEKLAVNLNLNANIIDMLNELGFENVKQPYGHWVSSSDDDKMNAGYISLKSCYFHQSNGLHHLWLVASY